MGAQWLHRPRPGGEGELLKAGFPVYALEPVELLLIEHPDDIAAVYQVG
jgi:hypothetical protein